MYFILYYYFGVNVLRWCPIFHLFDTPFQNLRYSNVNNNNNNSKNKPTNINNDNY